MDEDGDDDDDDDVANGWIDLRFICFLLMVGQCLGRPASICAITFLCNCNCIFCGLIYGHFGQF